jgi:O-acetyl-ADP-ribose deacetylase (regulator of RNase III)
VIGNLFTSSAQSLVNTVNCVGVMGKGVALEFKKRYPAMHEDYVQRCERKAVRLGEPYLYEDSSGIKTINFPTKDHWRSPSRLQDIERGLDFLVHHIADWKVTSTALPPLGCGNGGLEWAEVGPLVFRKLSTLPIDVELYAPYGTLGRVTSAVEKLPISSIKEQRANLISAHAVQQCSYQVLLYADDEDAVIHAEAAHVVAAMMNDIVEKLDSLKVDACAKAPTVTEVDHPS